MLIPARSKLLFIGDSITDAGRTRPIAEGLFDPLGKGYVAQAASLLGATYPECPLRVVNVGCSGHTVRDLKARWQTDVIDLKPDWLSIMIGTNDVWRQFDSPLFPELAVQPDEYEQTLDGLVSTTRPLVKGLVLMTPFYIEPNPADAMRARMDQYGKIALTIAKKHGVIGVDTQAAFNRVLAHQHSSNLAWDRVHPNAVGHMVLARAFLDALGFSWQERSSIQPV
ncbi:MAG: SGNH/GDSL hydrolase family protein [Planctomycetota bacterium]